MTNFYDEQELRALVMPLAVTLVNTEPQRVMGNCNTKAIAEVISELANIVKFGVVNPVETPGQEVLPPVAQQNASMQAQFAQAAQPTLAKA